MKVMKRECSVRLIVNNANRLYKYMISDNLPIPITNYNFFFMYKNQLNLHTITRQAPTRR